MLPVELNSLPSKEIIPGFHGKFVHGEKITVAFWEVEAGSQLPEHAHVHEQTSMLMEGKFEMIIDGTTHLLRPGQLVVIPSMVKHSGRAITNCRIIDNFIPRREEYRVD
jgi:quercetin dioxygenase-like cupin family protein